MLAITLKLLIGNKEDTLTDFTHALCGYIKCVKKKFF